MSYTPQQKQALLKFLEDYKNSERFDEHMSRDIALLVPRTRTINVEAIKANAKTEGNLRIAQRLTCEGPK